MQRRSFIQSLFSMALYPGVALAAAKSPAEPARILIQESPLAAFQYYRGEAVWPALRCGAPLHLVREPSYRHDPPAIAVYWHDNKLGYVPRAESVVLAQMLDRGQALDSRIIALTQDVDPWRRLRFAVMAHA